MPVTVGVIGLDSLRHELDELERQLGGDAVDKALFEGGFLLEGVAKAKAPIGTAFLANSIYTTSSTESNYAEAEAAATACNPRGRVLPEARPQKAQCIVSVGAEYGIHVEFGTSRMAARPFMRAAFDGYREQAVSAIRQAIHRLVEESFGR